MNIIKEITFNQKREIEAAAHLAHIIESTDVILEAGYQMFLKGEYTLGQLEYLIKTLQRYKQNDIPQQTFRKN